MESNVRERIIIAQGSNLAESSEESIRTSGATGTESPRIAAYDAGGTTGTALYFRGTLTLGQVKKPRTNMYAHLRELPEVDALAYEWFVCRGPLKEDHADVMYINGAIEAEAARRGIPVYRYLPRQSKSRVSDDTLKELGWWPGFGLRTGGHAADAARILLCTLIDNYPSELMNA